MELEDPEAPPQWCGPVCSKCLFKVSGAQAEEQRVIPTHSDLPILLKAHQGVVFRLVWLEKMGSTGLDGLDAIHLAGNPHPFVKPKGHGLTNVPPPKGIRFCFGFPLNNPNQKEATALLLRHPRADASADAPGAPEEDRQAAGQGAAAPHRRPQWGLPQLPGGGKSRDALLGVRLRRTGSLVGGGFKGKLLKPKGNH